jgi:class 3 adenylate cyclase
VDRDPFLQVPQVLSGLLCRPWLSKARKIRSVHSGDPPWPKSAERRLAAILAADVAGYSRLIGAEEEGTLAQLKAQRRALVDPKIKQRRGRIVKTTGDGMLVEFASVVGAVCCAVDVQHGMVKRNAESTEDGPRPSS